MTAKKPTHAQLSRELGLSRGRITQLAKLGMPLYSLEAATAWRAQNVAPRAGSTRKAENLPATDPGQGGGVAIRYDESRARREAAEASIAEHKQAELQGQLIRVEAVEAVWSRAMAGVREHLLQLSSRLSPILAGEIDPLKISHLLDTEIHAALNFMASAEQPPNQRKTHVET